MSEDWYLLKEGRQSGPYTADHLRQMAREGKLGGEDLIWNSMFSAWMRVDKIPGFLPVSGQEAPAFLHDYPSSQVESTEIATKLQVVRKKRRWPLLLLLLVLLFLVITGLGRLSVLLPPDMTSRVELKSLFTEELIPPGNYIGVMEFKTYLTGEMADLVQEVAEPIVFTMKIARRGDQYLVTSFLLDGKEHANDDALRFTDVIIFKIAPSENHFILFQGEYEQFVKDNTLTGNWRIYYKNEKGDYQRSGYTGVFYAVYQGN